MSEQETTMAGIEGKRPQPKEAAFNAGVSGGATPRGERYEQSELHHGGTPVSETRLSNGKPKDIAFLYTDRRQGGPLRWSTERQSITSWLEEVRDGHERGDSRYERIPEDRVPSTIVHHRPYIPPHILERHPEYAQREWVHLRFLDSPTITFLNPQVPGAEQRTKPEEKQFVGETGREANDLPHQPGEDDPAKARAGQTEREAGRSQRAAWKGTEARPGGKSSEDRSSELQAYEQWLRDKLREERERRGESFNETEFVRQQLAGELSRATGEKQKYLHSFITSFDAIAYSRYTSDTIKQDALDRYEKDNFVHDGWIDSHIVPPSQSNQLAVLAHALDIRYPYQSGDGIKARVVSPSSELIRDLSERRGEALKIIPVLRARKHN